MSSTPNENGYCHWCVKEGMHSRQSQMEYEAKIEAMHVERKRLEDEQWEQEKRDYDEWCRS